MDFTKFLPKNETAIHLEQYQMLALKCDLSINKHSDIVARLKGDNPQHKCPEGCTPITLEFSHTDFVKESSDINVEFSFIKPPKTTRNNWLDWEELPIFTSTSQAVPQLPIGRVRGGVKVEYGYDLNEKENRIDNIHLPLYIPSDIALGFSTLGNTNIIKSYIKDNIIRYAFLMLDVTDIIHNELTEELGVVIQYFEPVSVTFAY